MTNMYRRVLFSSRLNRQRTIEHYFLLVPSSTPLFCGSWTILVNIMINEIGSDFNFSHSRGLCQCVNALSLHQRHMDHSRGKRVVLSIGRRAEKLSTWRYAPPRYICTIARYQGLWHQVMMFERHLLNRKYAWLALIYLIPSDSNLSRYILPLHTIR